MQQSRRATADANHDRALLIDERSPVAGAEAEVGAGARIRNRHLPVNRPRRELGVASGTDPRPGDAPSPHPRITDSWAPIKNVWAGHPGTLVEAQEVSRRLPGGAEAPDLTRTPPGRLLAVLATAWQIYSSGRQHRSGLAYLAHRQIDARVLETATGRIEVGYVPAGRDRLVRQLTAVGFSIDELVDAGLARRPTGGGPAIDTYRDRVVLPIRDMDGRVCGLVGRNLGHPARPKYLNPPRTAVYDKSVDLYQPLATPVHPDGRVIVVEGTLDAMAIAVAAIITNRADRFCPITQSGRELSDQQIRRVLAMSSNSPVLGFDGDQAGVDAATRYCDVFAGLGAPVAVTVLPDGHDPVSWLAERGPTALSAWDPNRQSPLDGVRCLTGERFRSSPLAASRSGPRLGPSPRVGRSGPASNQRQRSSAPAAARRPRGLRHGAVSGCDVVVPDVGVEL